MRRVTIALAAALLHVGNSPSDVRGAEFANLQVLGRVTERELYAAMNFMAGSLGVTCEHCHVNPWASDTKAAKRTARAMIRMVRSLNSTEFAGRIVVTCQTCHRGSIRTSSAPAIEQAGWRTSSAAPARALPDAATVISRYVRRVGRRSDRRPLRRRLTGRGTIDNGMTTPRTFTFDIAIGGNSRLTVVERDGRRTSVTSLAPDAPMSADEREEALRALEAYLVFDPTLTKVSTVSESSVVNGEPAYIVLATGPAERVERLAFAIRSGELLRRETDLLSPLGTITERVDYDDYRRVGGLRLPFRITFAQFAERRTLVVTEAHVSPAEQSDRDSISLRRF